MRKLIAFDEDTFDKLRQLARDRMATFQELAEEAFADLLKKHGIPVDLKDALRKSAQPGGGRWQGGSETRPATKGVGQEKAREKAGLRSGFFSRSS
jgi:hypothetical protein